MTVCIPCYDICRTRTLWGRRAVVHPLAGDGQALESSWASLVHLGSQALSLSSHLAVPGLEEPRLPPHRSREQIPTTLACPPDGVSREIAASEPRDAAGEAQHCYPCDVADSVAAEEGEKALLSMIAQVAPAMHNPVGQGGKDG